MRLSLVTLLLLAACDKPSVTAPAPDGASSASVVTTASVTPVAAPSAKPVVALDKVDSRFTVYQGTVGKDQATLGIEQRGAEVRAVYVQGYGEPIDLDGKAKSDGSISVQERGFLTRKGSKLEFTIDAKNSLAGTLTDPKSKAPVKLALAAGTPFTDKDATFERSYEGSLGSATRIRVKWKRDKHLVTGVYRYTRSKEDLKLDGTVIASTGAFSITEKNAKGAVTGKWQGVFVTPAVVIARWSSPDGNANYPVSLAARDSGYPEIVSLPGGGRLTPQEEYSERGKACRSSVVYPAFDGISPAAVQTALNNKLRTLSGGGAPLKSEECEGAEDDMPYDMDTAYSISAMRPAFVGIEISHYAFTGGAHGNYGATCYVADLASGRLVRLAQELSGTALATLSALTTAQLRKDNNTTKLTDAGFFTDTPEVTVDSNVCVRDEGGVLHLEVSFQPYEIGPWAMGSPTVAISAQDAKPLFSPGTMGAAIYK